MSVTLAPSPWPAPASPRAEAGWRFARRIEGADAQGLRFELRRNLSLTPRQLLGAYGLMCLFSLAVAAGFWWHGVAFVGLFAGIELLGLGAALLVVARHAGDRETVTLVGREVAVEQCVGPEVICTAFSADWVRIEPVGGDGSLLELSGEGRTVRIGRHVRPEWRRALAQELRRALRLSRTTQHQTVDQDQQA